MHFWCLSFLCCCKRNRKKSKKKKNKAKNNYKDSVFKVAIQNEENGKNGFFSKNCLTLFASRREKKRAFSCTLSVLTKQFFGSKAVKTKRNYKNSGFSGNCPKPNMTLFFEKRFFLAWVKKLVLLCFWKAGLFWKHYVYSVFSKNTAIVVKKLYVKKQKIYEKLWVVFEHGKKVLFCLFFFLRF